MFSPFGNTGDASSAPDFLARAAAAGFTARDQQPQPRKHLSVAVRPRSAQPASTSQQSAEDALYAAAWGSDPEPAYSAPVAAVPRPAPRAATMNDRQLAALAGWDAPADDGEDRFPGKGC